MSVVQRWSGRETRALREAMRMTIVEFADRLGVSDRTVSKWEQGGAAKYPIPAMQQILDTAFSQCARMLGLDFTLSSAARHPSQLRSTNLEHMSSTLTSSYRSMLVRPR